MNYIFEAFLTQNCVQQSGGRGIVGHDFGSAGGCQLFEWEREVRMSVLRDFEEDIGDEALKCTKT